MVYHERINVNARKGRDEDLRNHGPKEDALKLYRICRKRIIPALIYEPIRVSRSDSRDDDSEAVLYCNEENKPQVCVGTFATELPADEHQKRIIKVFNRD